MRRLRRRLQAEDGTTLIEVIVTVAIMGIAFAALLGGMATSIAMSDVHRKQATAGTILRDYAEAVQGSQVWNGCNAAPRDYAPAAVGFTAPSASPARVQFWRTDLTPPAPPQFANACASGAVQTDLLLISLSVTSDRGIETVDVIKRCPGVRGTVATQCP